MQIGFPSMLKKLCHRSSQINVLKHNLTYFFGTELMREQEECVFLGVEINNNLTFHILIKSINSKFSKPQGTLFKLSLYFPLNILKKCNNFCHIPTCNTVIWSGALHIRHMSSLKLFCTRKLYNLFSVNLIVITRKIIVANRLY